MFGPNVSVEKCLLVTGLDLESVICALRNIKPLFIWKLGIIWLKLSDPNSCVFPLKQTSSHLGNLNIPRKQSSFFLGIYYMRIMHFQRSQLDVSRSMPEVLIITTVKHGAV